MDQQGKQVENKTILIPGGAGFIGTNLIQKLQKRNKIIVIDTCYRDPDKVEWMKNHDQVIFYHKDICDTDTLNALSNEKITHIIQLAAVAGVETVNGNPMSAMKTNLTGGLSLINWAKDLPRLEHFIYFSSSEIYGASADNVDESDVNLSCNLGVPRHTYAVGKIANEFLLYQYWRSAKMPITIIRPFNIYGPHQVADGAIVNFVVNSLARRPLSIRGSGKQVRSWCYVDDLIESIMLVLENPSSKGEVFNIGNPSAVCSTNELAACVRDLTKTDVEINCVPWPHDDVAIRVPVIDKAQTILGFIPRTNLQDGLTKTIKWYRQFHATGSAYNRIKH